MKSEVVRWNRLVPGFLVALLAVSGAWWSIRARAAAGPEQASPSVRVFIRSPAHGQEIEAGKVLPVRLQALAPAAIAESELFVDGLSLGAVRESAESASWFWQAWQPGLHSLYARAATADGQVGRSAAIIVNVLAGDDTIEVLAERGQTLQQIGSFFGIAPVEMAHANPQLDPNPTVPLEGGVRVQVPVPSLQPQTESPSATVVPGPPVISIHWKIEMRGAVDRSYCYVSDSSGEWQRLPADPSLFLEGADSDYNQLLPFTRNVQLAAECWGWLEDELQFLGDGHTAFDTAAAPDSIVIRGGGFDLTGALSIPDVPAAADTLNSGIPAPYGVRKPLSAGDCAAHGLAADQCDFLFTEPHPAYIVLEWEWRAPFCVGAACGQARVIDGYRLYVVDSGTGDAAFVSQIDLSEEKVGVYPLASGSHCYGVRAFVTAPAFAESDLAMHCPGPPPAQNRVIEPEHWLTTGQLSEAWFDAFEAPPGAVVVSATNYGNEVRSSAGVKFHLEPLPLGGVLHRAVLRFSVLFQQADTAGENSALEPFCVAALGQATRDWSGLSGGDNHYVTGLNLLASPDYSTPVISLPEFVGPAVEVDVTPLVGAWLQDPSRNHGLVLVPRHAPMAGPEAGAFCNSVEGDFHLQIEYLMP